MDAKSLLRAKKAEARIEHPYAAYSASGVLRCSICAVPVKQWDAHLLTKQHRTSVAREKAIQAKASAKRSAPDPAEDKSSKRSKTGPTLQDGDEDADEEPSAGALPAGFFSSGNGPSLPTEEETETTTGPERTGDAELDDFLASLEDDDAPTLPSTSSIPQPKANRGYQLGSSIAAPGIASYEAAPIRLPQPGEEGAEGREEEKEAEETEEEKRDRIAREEKEEIMGRLEDEERAQEDADSRVTALKARMEALKKKREGRPAKTKPSTKTNGA